MTRPAPLKHASLGAPSTRAQLDREHQLERFPMLLGRWVTGTFEVADFAMRVKHGLGRAYVGAMSPVHVTAPGGLVADIGIMPVAPESLRAGGIDPAVWCYWSRSTAAQQLTLRFWVF